MDMSRWTARETLEARDKTPSVSVSVWPGDYSPPVEAQMEEQKTQEAQKAQQAQKPAAPSRPWWPSLLQLAVLWILPPTSSQPEYTSLVIECPGPWMFPFNRYSRHLPSRR